MYVYMNICKENFFSRINYWWWWITAEVGIRYFFQGSIPIVRLCSLSMVRYRLIESFQNFQFENYQKYSPQGTGTSHVCIIFCFEMWLSTVEWDTTSRQYCWWDAPSCFRCWLWSGRHPSQHTLWWWKGIHPHVYTVDWLWKGIQPHVHTAGGGKHTSLLSTVNVGKK